jgi:cellulose synthase/poly-beta-1,6-N-acetylglucosamine synthase-like glycosyltransferase
LIPFPIKIDAVFIFALLSIWALLLYNVFLMIQGFRYGNRQERKMPTLLATPAKSPKISLIVPAHDEELVIERTLRALLALDYPRDKLEIIVINDASTDSTGAIIERVSEEDNRIKPIHTTPERGGRGKSAALNLGLRFATGEVIGVYDADNTPEPYVLRYMVAVLLSDNALGAVVGKVRTRNRFSTVLTRFINIEFIAFQWMTQAGGWNTHRVSIIPGTNFLIWKRVLEECGGWDERAIAEDTELTIRLYQHGYFVQFVPGAVTWEQEPETWRVWFGQRRRWARGNQYVVAKHLRHAVLLHNRAVASIVLYMLLVYGFFWLAVVLSDLVFVLSILGLAYMEIQGPFLFLWLAAYVLFVVEIMVTLTLEKNENTIANFLLTCVMYFTYCQLWLVLVIVSTFDWVVRPGVTWKKTARSEEF